jgi:hypothetical protein
MKSQREVFETISTDRLQVLAHHAALIADSLGATGAYFYVRGKNTPPSWIHDVDPSAVIIEKDEVTIRLGGGGSFYFQRSDSDSDLWLLMRCEDTSKVQTGTYRHTRGGK